MSKSFTYTTDKFEHRRKAAVKKARKTELEKREARRASHWKKTGVSDATVEWMREGGWL